MDAGALVQAQATVAALAALPGAPAAPTSHPAPSLPHLRLRLAHAQGRLRQAAGDLVAARQHYRPSASIAARVGRHSEPDCYRSLAGLALTHPTIPAARQEVESAAALMTALYRILTATPELRPAALLRQAQLAALGQEDGTTFAHSMRRLGKEEDEFIGRVHGTPGSANGVGTWTLQVGVGLTRTVVADAATRFDTVLPGVGQRVEVEATEDEQREGEFYSTAVTAPGSGDGSGSWQVGTPIRSLPQLRPRVELMRVRSRSE